MKKLKVHIIKKEEIYQTLGNDILPEWYMKDYLRCFPDILDNVDIFCENCRSKEKSSKDFSLFEITDKENSDVYVFSIYLELFEVANKQDLIKTAISTFSNLYKDKIVVFFWNHDRDFIYYNDHVNQFNNVRIINYNTSEKTKNDIIVPFWTLNTKEYKEKKKYNYGLIVSMTHHCRQILYNSFANKPYFFYSSNIKQPEYFEMVSSFVYNFCPRGAGLSSWRFFETFHLNSIPVLFADDVVLPYDNINYDDICVRLPEHLCQNYEQVVEILTTKDIKKMLENIEKTKWKFTLKGVQQEIYDRLLVDIQE